MTRMQVVLCCTLALGGLSGAAAGADETAKDIQAGQGVWTYETQVVDGKETPAAQAKALTVTIEGDKYTVRRDGQLVQAGTYKLDPSKSPRAIDMTVVEGPAKGTVMPGIYQFDGDVMRVCFDATGRKRPTEFKSAAGSGTYSSTHKRVKPDAGRAFSLDEGVWSYESQVVDGEARPAEFLAPMTITYQGDRWTLKRGDEVYSAGTQKVDPTKSPKAIDVTVTDGKRKGETLRGIYELDGDTLKTCFAPEGKGRPTAFESKAGSGAYLSVQKRVRK